jgi:hypothetical protein
VILSRRELPVLAANAAYLLLFGGVAAAGRNLEFVFYSLVIFLVGFWIVWKQPSVQFGLGLLWCLTLWGFLHMSGGLIRVGEGVLYGLQLIPVLLRYDQLVHAFGFGVATLICHHLLRFYLRPDLARWKGLAILVVLMGGGVGCVNEIVEFIAVKTIPETGVGGYDNTLCDLIFNMIGATVAVLLMRVKGRFP